MSTQSITSRFKAHDCAKQTATENKRYIAPYMLKSRAARVDGLEQPGNILQEPGKHWNGLTWKNADGDLVFADRVRTVEGQRGSSLYRNNDLAKRPGKYTWKNILVQPETEPFNSGMKWGTREYNVPEREFIDCDFFAIPREHGIYASNYADTTVDRCTFIRMGSQGVQFAHRSLPYQQYQADNRPYEESPTHTLRDSHFIDCGQGGDRASYNATYFDPGSPEHPGTLKVDGCSFVANWDETKDGYKSTGALVVTPMGGTGPLTSNFMTRVEVTNTLFDFTAGDRSIVNIRSTDEVVFEDCVFIARNHTRPNVDIDSPAANMGRSKTKRIVLRNCVGIGNVRLRVFGPDSTGWTDNISHDINCRGSEIVIDGETGKVISSRKLPSQDPSVRKRLADRIARARREYFGS